MIVIVNIYMAVTPQGTVLSSTHTFGHTMNPKNHTVLPLTSHRKQKVNLAEIRDLNVKGNSTNLLEKTSAANLHNRVGKDFYTKSPN